ncbi:unnamed protein product [Amoebophrya sp. A120]|nr:unnamed protein product [Amoebophrya sp. A120]|eukprot:GSA120T00003733001.1
MADLKDCVASLSTGGTGGAFGEATSVPITVTKIEILEAPCERLQKSLLQVDITLENRETAKETTAKLRLPLPNSCRVVQLDLETKDGVFVPATAVPKKKTKEIVYKEKEAGRSVGAGTQVGGSNVFEMELFPILPKVPTRCRVKVLATMSSVGEGGAASLEKDLKARLSPLLLAESNIESGFVYSRCASSSTTAATSAPNPTEPACVVMDCFGAKHFAIRVPPRMSSQTEMAAASSPGATPAAVSGTTSQDQPAVVSVFWDTSGSREDGAEKRLVELEKVLRKLKPTKSFLGFTLHTFDMEMKEHKAATNSAYHGVDSLLAVLRSLKYDGGTDVSKLPIHLAKVMARLSHDENDAATVVTRTALVFTDGLDVFGRTPDFAKYPLDGETTVHVIADESAQQNATVLRALTLANAARPGRLVKICIESTTTTAKQNTTQSAGAQSQMLERILQEGVSGIRAPQEARLHRITSNQSDEAFQLEYDDGFRCFPDHRLAFHDIPLEHEDVIIAGIVGDEVTEATVEVRGRDGALETFTLQFTKEPASTASSFFTGAFSFGKDLLGYLYAETQYQCIQKDALRSGLNLSKIQEELAVRYCFCSPEASLLLLHTEAQFRENDVPPPLSHPIRAEWEERQASGKNSPKNKNKPPKSIFEADSDTSDSEDDKVSSKNELGTLKRVEVYEKTVGALVTRLHDFIGGEMAERTRVKRKGQRKNTRGRGGKKGGGKGGGGDGLFLMSASAPAPRMMRMAAAAPQGAMRGFAPDAREVVEDEEEDAMEFGLEGCEAPMMMMESVNSVMTDALPASAALLGGGAPPAPAAPATWGGRSRGVPAGLKSAGAAEQEGATAPGVSAAGPAVTASTDPELYEAQLRSVLPEIQKQTQPTDVQEELPMQATAVYFQLKEVNKRSPSFFLSCARQLRDRGFIQDGIRVASNCLELSLEEPQLLRTVAYYLLSVNSEAGNNLAITIFDHVAEICPVEPQSFLDMALARLRLLFIFRDGKKKSLDDEINAGSNLALSQALRVVTHNWAGRFTEVEWPALILMQFIREEVQLRDTNLTPTLYPPLFMEKCKPPLNDFQLLFPTPEKWKECNLCVWLAWDTDKTDLDLHVIEPTGEEVYYGNRESAMGGYLSRDFTQGYGPEVYLLKNPGYKPPADDLSQIAPKVYRSVSEEIEARVREGTTGNQGRSLLSTMTGGLFGGRGGRGGTTTANRGDGRGGTTASAEEEKKATNSAEPPSSAITFKVRVKYYGSHQDSPLTGATSCVIWALCRLPDQSVKVEFFTARLSNHKQVQDVMEIRYDKDGKYEGIAPLV